MRLYTAHDMHTYTNNHAHCTYTEACTDTGRERHIASSLFTLACNRNTDGQKWPKKMQQKIVFLCFTDHTANEVPAVVTKLSGQLHWMVFSTKISCLIKNWTDHETDEWVLSGDCNKRELEEVNWSYSLRGDSQPRTATEGEWFFGYKKWREREWEKNCCPPWTTEEIISKNQTHNHAKRLKIY